MMIRTLLLASAFALASPALAQQAEAPADPIATDTTSTETVAEPAAPTEPAPAQDSVTEAASAPTESTTTTTTTAAAQPSATAQVAQVVEADFPAYDTDKNGELSATEFAAWMTKLKAASTPAGATAAADPAWTGKAFAQADTDKSKTVSKVELTTFLSG